MWVIPKTYLPSSLSARDMVASSEDLTLPELDIESSLLWRSKPSLLRTWSTRWKRVSWLQHLSGRILKPSRQDFFEDLLISSLEATRASRSRQPGSEKEKTTPDTFGPTYQRLSGSYDPGEFSLRMSKVTLASGLTKSSAIWKREVTIRRGAYLARVKSALSTSASESTSWGAPGAADGMTNPLRDLPKGHNCRSRLEDEVAVAAMWPTPSAHEARLGYQDRSRGKKGTQESLTTVLVNVAGGRKVCTGHLNPHWVERLMGVPDGWTRLGAVVIDYAVPWNGKWEDGVPRVVEACDDRVDRIRLLGNGVVPQTAAKAWTTLNEERADEQ